MTKYELPDGTTVMIPTELLLRMTDTELQDYLCNARGMQIKDPFFDSVLESGESVIFLEDLEIPEDIIDLPEGFIEES